MPVCLTSSVRTFVRMIWNLLWLTVIGSFTPTATKYCMLPFALIIRVLRKTNKLDTGIPKAASWKAFICLSGLFSFGKLSYSYVCLLISLFMPQPTRGSCKKQIRSLHDLIRCTLLSASISTGKLKKIYLNHRRPSFFYYSLFRYL